MPKVITYVLCQDLLLKTDAQNTTWRPEIFEPEQLRNLGPMIAGIRVHYVCEGASDNFSARVTSYWSVLGKSWSVATELMPAETGNNTGEMSTAVGTSSAFGLLMRYAIETKNSSGVAIELGRVTVILEIELKS